MEINRKSVTFYVLTVTSLILIFLTDTAFHDDGTVLTDKIIIAAIICNLVLFSVSYNKMLIYIVILQFLYTILTVSYNDEIDGYFYRISDIFNVGKIHSKSISNLIQIIWFISFLLSSLLEAILLIKLFYNKILNK